MTTHDITYLHKRRFTAKQLPELLRILEQDKARGIRYRVRGRFSKETFKKMNDHYYETAERFANRQEKKGITYQSTNIHGCLHCLHSEDFYDDFVKTYPNLQNPYYNDILISESKTFAKSPFPVEFWDLYVY